MKSSNAPWPCLERRRCPHTARWAKECRIKLCAAGALSHNEAMLRTATKWESWSGEKVSGLLDHPVGKPGHAAQCRNQLNEMITRDHNRAALIFIRGNGPRSAKRENHFLRQLIQDAHSSGPYSPGLRCSASAETSGWRPFTIHINDPIGDDLDVLGTMNISAGTLRHP